LQWRLYHQDKLRYLQPGAGQCRSDVPFLIFTGAAPRQG
jgi:hypothetical protein